MSILPVPASGLRVAEPRRGTAFIPDLTPVREEQFVYDHHTYEYEAEAEQALRSLLSPHFALRRQVHMRHWSGVLGRIDYMAVPLCEFPVDWFGIEVKRSFAGFQGFTDGLRQAVFYRQSVVEEKRFPKLAGERFPLVLLWPTPVGYGGFGNGMLGGAMRMAGKFNVGAIVTEHGQPRFIGCGHHLWWSPSNGPTTLLNQIAGCVDRGWEPR